MPVVLLMRLAAVELLVRRPLIVTLPEPASVRVFPPRAAAVVELKVVSAVLLTVRVWLPPAVRVPPLNVSAPAPPIVLLALSVVALPKVYPVVDEL